MNITRRENFKLPDLERCSAAGKSVAGQVCCFCLFVYVRWQPTGEDLPKKKHMQAKSLTDQIN